SLASRINTGSGPRRRHVGSGVSIPSMSPAILTICSLWASVSDHPEGRWNLAHCLSEESSIQSFGLSDVAMPIKGAMVSWAGVSHSLRKEDACTALIERY